MQINIRFKFWNEHHWQRSTIGVKVCRKIDTDTNVEKQRRFHCLRRTTKKSHCETENHFQRNSNTQTHYLIAFVSDLTEGGHHGLERQSSIICPILRHLLPIMVKLFISSAGTEEETLRKHSAKSRNRGRSERQNQPNQWVESLLRIGRLWWNFESIF